MCDESAQRGQVEPVMAAQGVLRECAFFALDAPMRVQVLLEAAGRRTLETGVLGSELAFLAKPLTPDRLNKKVREALQRKRQPCAAE